MFEHKPTSLQKHRDQVAAVRGPGKQIIELIDQLDSAKQDGISRKSCDTLSLTSVFVHQGQKPSRLENGYPECNRCCDVGERGIRQEKYCGTKQADISDGAGAKTTRREIFEFELRDGADDSTRSTLALWRMQSDMGNATNRPERASEEWIIGSNAWASIHDRKGGIGRAASRAIVEVQSKFRFGDRRPTSFSAPARLPFATFKLLLFLLGSRRQFIVEIVTITSDGLTTETLLAKRKESRHDAEPHVLRQGSEQLLVLALCCRKPGGWQPESERQRQS
ncbi:hypothetical protein B0H14DRAFT_3559405 [Mycena olivaceomarginata]|nr:hypothetical protein B0H14DRAFT_3559405 [Mycena olivaceomarginata]